MKKLRKMFRAGMICSIDQRRQTDVSLMMTLDESMQYGIDTVYRVAVSWMYRGRLLNHVYRITMPRFVTLPTRRSPLRLFAVKTEWNAKHLNCIKCTAIDRSQRSILSRSLSVRGQPITVGDFTLAEQ